MSDAVIHKPWGTVSPVWEQCRATVCFCRAVAGGFTSVHRHRDHANLFLVIDGELTVDCYGIGDEPVATPGSSITLTAGESLSIAAGVWHGFRGDRDSRFLETYIGTWRGSVPPIQGPLDDIERSSLHPASGVSQ